jgi:hypothetical protein
MADQPTCGIRLRYVNGAARLPSFSTFFPTFPEDVWASSRDCHPTRLVSDRGAPRHRRSWGGRIGQKGF